MKTKILITVFLTSFLNFAQQKEDLSVVLDSKIVDLYIHDATGIPVAITNGAVYGINGETGKKIWEFKESGFVKNLNALGQDGGSSFQEIPFSPFGKFGSKVFNIKTGQKTIDNKTNNYNKLLDNRYVTGQKAILFIAKTDKKTETKLLLVSCIDNTVTWNTVIKSAKKFSSQIDNYIQNKDKIAFTAGQTIFLINKNDGKIILTKKYDAGKLFFTEDNASLIAVENKSSSLIGSTLKAGFTMGLSLLKKDPIGKELFAFNTTTGKEVWKKSIQLDEGFVDYQFENNNLFLIHKDGAKLYDYNTGKEVWKKEFKQKKVSGVEKTAEGYLVYYKNKKHLVDSTGKKIWKKSKKVIDNVDFEVDDEEDYSVFRYDKGTLFVTPFRIEYFEKGKEKRVYRISLDESSDKLVFDKKNKNLLLLRNKKLFILNPDKELGKEQFKKIAFNDYNKINTVETRDQGYFINSNWEYVLTDFNGNIIKKEYFTQPGEGLRHLKNIGAGFASIGTIQLVRIENEEKPKTSSNFVRSHSSNSRKNISKDTINLSKHRETFEDLTNYLYTPKRYNAFKATKNSAFFYTKKGDKKVLLQINKDTGDITNSYEFGVDKPKYKIDKLEKRIYFRKENELKIFSYN